MKKIVLRKVDNWRFWAVVWGFAIVGAYVFLFALNQRTIREETARTAAAKAAASTQVGQCFTSVKDAPITQRFLRAHEALIDNGIIGNRAALRTLPGSDPLTAVRRASLKRLQAAKANARELEQRVARITPTQAKCVQLAKRLHVDYGRYVKGPQSMASRLG